MAKYMLISVCDREITTEMFGSLNEAQVAMRSEMIEAGVNREDLYEYDDEFNEVPKKDPEDAYVFGESEYSAYVNGKCECDWLIVKANGEGLSAKEEVDALSETALWVAYNKAEVINTEQVVQSHFNILKETGDIPKDAVLPEYAMDKLVHELLYEEDCFPSGYERVDDSILSWYKKTSSCTA